MLLKVKKAFWTSGEKLNYGVPVKHKIKKGEIIEIRYPYAWHFRTEQNIYEHAKEEVLFNNCVFYGQIYSEIRFENKLELTEILEKELYHKSDEYKLVLKEV